MSELAVVKQETRLATAQPMEFSTEQIRILAETVAKDCNQNELAFFLNVAKLKRLDPFSGQIHVVKRWDSALGANKITVQVGIDGYRVIASRTGDMAGIDEPIYNAEDEPNPQTAKVTVYRYGRNDEKIPYTATARWSEYVQTKKDGGVNHMWKTKPYLMLGKVAEALALRKAFPDELSGMYTDEEMDQADNHHPGQPDPKPPVNMPKSTQQTAQATQQTTQGAQQANPTQSSATVAQTKTTTTNGPEQIKGVIESTKVQKDDLWMVLDKKTVVVRAGKTDAGMVPGAKLIVEAVKKAFKNGDEFYETQEVVTLLPPDGEVIEGEIVEPDPVGPTVADAALASDELKGMFGDHPQSREEDAEKQQAQRAKREEVIAKGREGDKPGTAGFARGQRLHILITANAKNTGFGEPELARFLKSIRLEHARDLTYVKDSKDFSVNNYALCEGMALGEVDWNQYVPD